MLKHLILNGLSFILIASESVQASNTLLTQIKKSDQGDWSVAYKAAEPIEKIVFNNSPNGSRVERWSSDSGEFEIVYQERQESIHRKDGKSFTTARFNLTPTYTHLPKNYGPFSPLSDGGMIFHSGRFFACIGVCDGSVNNWRMTLNVPKGDNIVLDGNVLSETASWADHNSGKSIYVGQQEPVETAGTLSIIDQGLPQAVLESLDKDIPKLMLYFEKKLGKLRGKDKPTLFASYSNRPGKDQQGGTLLGQVFMHWDYDDLEDRLNSEEFINGTLRFFAHEIAHLFQSRPTGADNNNEAWVHEGSADLFAINILLDLYPETKHYIKSFQKNATEQCIEALKTLPLAKASESGKFKMHYHCGLLIHQRIEQALAQSKSSPTLYGVWQEYRENVIVGDANGQKTFLSVVEKHTTAELRHKIESFIREQHADPQLALNTLFE